MRKAEYKRWVKRVYNVIALLIIVSLIYAGILSVFQENYVALFNCVLAFVLVLIPFFVKRIKSKLPTEIELVIVIFIYATLFLGEVRNFYYTVWWWDILVHGFSAIVFGFIGFTILYFMVNRHELEAKPWALAIFSFSFAMAIGALWEIFEFSVDSIFGANMQKSGLIDTMWDLIVDAIGALFASAAAFLYLKSKKTLLFGSWIKNKRKS